MKKFFRFISLMLIMSMLLALCACGTASSPQTSPSAPVVDTSVEDLILATAGVPGDCVLFTVDDVPVTARLYCYVVATTISYLNSMGSALDLSSLSEYLKTDSLNASAWYVLVKAKATQLGYQMTEAQITELDGNIAMAQAMMGGEEAFNEALRQNGLDYDTYYLLQSTPYYFTQMEEGMFADRPSEEELEAYIQSNDILMAKHILLSTVDTETRTPLDEAAIAQKKATAEDLLKRLQESDDLSADFDALMHEYSEDPGLASYPDGYVFTAGEMISEFETATRALEYGQISGIVEGTGTGFHIILRLDPATEEIEQSCRAALMDDQMMAWVNEAEIVLNDEYKNLDITSFYNNLTAYQKAFSEESQSNS